MGEQLVRIRPGRLIDLDPVVLDVDAVVVRLGMPSHRCLDRRDLLRQNLRRPFLDQRDDPVDALADLPTLGYLV
jgi:hypothetical protein